MGDSPKKKTTLAVRLAATGGGAEDEPSGGRGPPTPIQPGEELIDTSAVGQIVHKIKSAENDDLFRIKDILGVAQEDVAVHAVHDLLMTVNAQAMELEISRNDAALEAFAFAKMKMDLETAQNRLNVAHREVQQLGQKIRVLETKIHEAAEGQSNAESTMADLGNILKRLEHTSATKDAKLFHMRELLRVERGKVDILNDTLAVQLTQDIKLQSTNIDLQERIRELEGGRR